MFVFREGEALCVEVVVDETERAARKEIGGCVDVPSSLGSQGEGGVREAMGRDVWDRGGQDGFLDRIEGARRLRPVV